GHVARGWIGVTAQDLDEDLAEFFKAENASEQGALISHITQDSPVKKQIKAGDVVLRINEKPITDAAHLKSVVSHASSGEKLAFDIRREGHSLELELTVGTDPKATVPTQRKQVAGTVANKPAKKPTLGVQVENIPAEIMEFLDDQIRSGVIVVGVNPGTPAFDAGLFAGDIILKVNKTQIHDTKDFSKAVKDLKPDAVTVLYVQRGPEEKLFVPLRA
ncbi:MAG TPA: hypothetical protein DCS07_01205, partial [Bdellovibrionales bacterium]|nr:hypothetical protein [Bdellovibrionales bacterium]